MSTVHLTLSAVYTTSLQPHCAESVCLLSAQFSVSESSKPALCCSRLPVSMLYLNASLLSTVCRLSFCEKNVSYFTGLLQHQTIHPIWIFSYSYHCSIYKDRHLCLFLIYHFMGHFFFTLSHFKRQEKFCINYWKNHILLVCDLIKAVQSHLEYHIQPKTFKGCH